MTQPATSNQQLGTSNSSITGLFPISYFLFPKTSGGVV